jgi:diguanylate cyclase (GGDEF)-like protein
MRRFVEREVMVRSWLCPTELDRQRVVDTSARVRRARLLGSAAVGVGVVILAPILSWWLLAVFGVAMLNLLTLDRRMVRSMCPGRVVAASMLYTEACIAAAVIITGGPSSPVLPLLVLPVGMASARFRQVVVLAGAAIVAIAIVAIGLVVDAHSLVNHPATTIVTLALLANVVAIGAAIQGAELQHRTESVLDPLTGLLNRKALRARFNELEEQARLADGSVCLIEADLDHFKRVNDTYGHERGDAVLRDSAYQMRKSLRSFELMYRLGGEEFLIVLPRVDLDEGMAVAERLREIVERSRPGDLEITISLGVAVARGEGVDYERLFAAADQALYAAKRAGRNRVEPPPADREPDRELPVRPPQPELA